MAHPVHLVNIMMKELVNMWVLNWQLKGTKSIQRQPLHQMTKHSNSVTQLAI